MTDNEIQYKAFLAVWKVLRQGQSEYYFKIEKYIKQYIDGNLTKDQFAAIYPEGIDAIIEEQKKRNLEMLVKALLATSSDKWERAKRLNSSKIDQLRQKT